MTRESPAAPPVTGTVAIPPTLSAPILTAMGHQPPTMSFPVFSGDNPQLWRTLCEQYFTMFAVHESYWVSMAVLHFSGTAAIWSQSVQKCISNMGWEQFTTLLSTRFG